MYAKALKETASTLTLLYVENDPETKEQFGMLLSRFFKETVYAENGEQALGFYRERRFDLVMTDIEMPFMDGPALIESIRNLDPMQPIVASSAVHDNELLIKLLNFGVSGFLTKPMDWNDAKKTMAAITQRIHEQQMLMHYFEELEKQQKTALDVTCGEECPVREVLDPDSEEEDEFLFFPEPTEEDAADGPEENLYEDYFSFLQNDDRDELKDQLDDIDASLLSAFGVSGADSQYVSKLGTAFVRYGNVLMRYQFFSDLGMVVLELGKMLADECDHVAEQAGQLQQVISGFCSVLQTFMTEVWEKDAEDPKFFNDSIKNDAGIIMGLIKPPQEDDNDNLVFF